MALIGREVECRALDALVTALHTGASQALVIHGDAGVGKTALLDYIAASAPGCRVRRISGMEAEADFAFAALHQVCAPLLGEFAGELPAPQLAALCTALGQRPGPVPDRFLLGLAVLALLSDTAERQPLLLLVDDHQWVDRASAQVLSFVGRRLGAESVGMVLATRGPSSDLAGLRQLPVTGLGDRDARSLIASLLDGPLDARVRDQIVAEARGNPLALLELPRTLSVAELAGGFGWPGGAGVPRTLEDSLRRQIEVLPEPSRRSLLLAAAEPAGDPSLFWAAAERLGLDEKAAQAAVAAGLIDFGTRVRFRHPMIRSTVYHLAPWPERRDVHRALAEVTDAGTDADRRAWHLGRAASGRDDEVADALERSAARAQARGGVAATAAFLERAAALTSDPARRCDRVIAAASAKAQAGDLEEAMALLTLADDAAIGEAQRARADLVRAQLALIANRGNDAAPLLLRAAHRLESIDADLARETYLDALSASVFAGRLAVDGGTLEVARTAATIARSAPGDRPADVLLDGLCRQHTVGFAAGLPSIRRALSAFAAGTMPAEQELRWMWLACIAAARIWDDERLAALSTRHVQLARDLGALGEVPLALSTRVFCLLFEGRLDVAEAAIAESDATVEAMGANMTAYGALALAAMRGRRAELTALGEAATRGANERGEGVGLTVVAWSKSLLENSAGNYRAAVSAARYATEYRGDCTSSGWATVELVEAASRSGMRAAATDALQRLCEMTTPSGTDWGLGLEARSRALLAGGGEAEELYCEAIARLGATTMRPDLARAHLLYGEWLRRQRHRSAARDHLRLAHDLFKTMEMSAFAERAAVELRAAGGAAHRRDTTAAATPLTAQEAQVARLARDGLTNAEIGARLFISARTVQYHLKKVFTKLAIRSRSQLETALTDPPA
jgi:DNA-binding CsgD family transcriptional regulator